MSLKLRNIIIFGALLPVIACGNAVKLPAEMVMGDAVYAYSTQAKPAKGGSYVDGTYHNTVTRVTNAAADTGAWGAQVEYSTWDIESSDGNYFLVQNLSDLSNAGNYVVYNRADNSVYRTLSFQTSNGQNSEPRWDRSGSHPTWIYYRSNKQLRYIDIADNSDHLVRDFSADFPSYGASYYIWNGDEGTCSADTRYWCFMLGSSNGNIVRVFTYDKQANAILGVQTTPAGNPPNSVSMSPSGQYIYIAYDWDGSGTWHDRPHIFRNDFTNPVQACHTIPHGVWAYDTQGREVYVYLNMFPTNDCIGFVRGDTGQAYELYLQNDMGWNGSNVNFSAPGIEKKGWALCSTYSDTGYGFWSDNQIWMIELDETKTTGTASEPRIWRLGPTQTYTGASYYYQQPNATINTAGTRVYFGANWRNVTGTEDVYRIDLPSTWFSDLGGVPGIPPVSGLNAPTGLLAELISPTDVSLRWSDTNGSQASYKIERAQDLSAGYSQLSVVNPGRATFIDSTLAQGNTYYYRVQALAGSQVSTYSNVVQVFANPRAGGTYIEDVDVVQTGEMRIVGPTERKGVINPDRGDTAKIFFKGNQIGTYECAIFDLNGKEVYRQSKSDLRMGMFEWVPNGMASGSYVATIIGPGFHQTKKIAVIR